MSGLYDLRTLAIGVLAAGLTAGFVLSLLPTDWDDTGKLAGGPLIHVGGFASLTLYASVVLGGQGRRLAVIAAGLFLYGAAIETAQSFVAWRNGEFLDLLYNGAGILAGIGIYLFVSPCLAVVRDRLVKG